MAEDTFLQVVVNTLGENMKAILEHQYKTIGVAGMVRYWGFSAGCIRTNLRKLGIKLKDKRRSNAPHGFASEAFALYGGVKDVLRTFKTMRAFSMYCGVSANALCVCLRKIGYKYNREEGRWERERE